MTVNKIFDLALYITGGIVGLIIFYNTALKKIVDKHKERNAKIERGFILDDQYEEDHEIIMEMASTINRIDIKLEDQGELLNKDYLLTLRNTIMNENLSKEERIEAYSDYKKLGGNGLVKEYAEKHLIKNERND